MTSSIHSMHLNSLSKLAEICNSSPNTDERTLIRQLLAWLGEQTNARAVLLAEKLHRRRPFEVSDCLHEGAWLPPFDLAIDSLGSQPTEPAEQDGLPRGSSPSGPHFVTGSAESLMLPFDGNEFNAVLVQPGSFAVAFIVVDPQCADADVARAAMEVAGGIWQQRLKHQTAAEEMRRRERNLRNALGANHAGYWEVDMTTGRLRTVGFEGVLGLSKDALPKTLSEWHDRIHPEDLPAIRAAHRTYSQLSPPKFDCEFRIKNGHGNWVWMRGQGASTMRLNPNDPPLRMAGLDSDITTEREMRTAREHQDQVLRQLDLAILTVNSVGKIIGSNIAAATRLGYTPQQLATLSFEDISPQIDPTKWQEIWKSCDNTLWESESLLRAGDGATFSAEIRVTRLPGSGIAHLALLTSSHRKSQQHAEWTQRQTLTEASRLQTMGELVGAIAHEMTQPLGAISNFASACRTRLRHGRTAEDGVSMKPEVAEQLLSWIDSVIDQSHRAGAIIDRLRQFSKRSAPHRSTFDLNKVLEESIQLHVGEAYSEEVKIRSKLEPGSPQVIIDEVQLHQVMANLIRNAFEATESNTDERWVIVQSEIQRDQVVVSIEDNGGGISEEIAERMYEPFETTRRDRMGVGLAIARSIVEAHHGRLWHANNPTNGVSFFFSVPLVAQQRQAKS